MRQYVVGTLCFEWDPAKAAANRLKHRVSFEEAATVFCDASATQFEDIGATDEERFLLLGFSNAGNLLVVVHCERGKHGNVIRLISARRATTREATWYQAVKP